MSEQSQEIKYIPNDVFYLAVEQLLKDGTDVEFTVTGNSMWPLLKHGRDTVILASYKGSGIKKGDIILFEPLPSKFLLHRVTRVFEKRIETAGDFNTFRDGIFPESCVRGKVIGITRKGKHYNPDTRLIKFYSICWMRLFAVRKPLLNLIRFISKIKN